MLASFYCIILLITLFLSTCYWSPISLDSSLSEPWAENITTFGEALNSTLASSYPKPLPSVFLPADRCWCDISTDGFFEPFSTLQWEKLSIQKLRDSLLRQEKIEEILEQELESQAAENDTQTYTAFRYNSSSIAKGIWSLLKSRSLQEPPAASPAEPDGSNSSAEAPSVDYSALPLFRREYDLRRFGVGLVLDFGSSTSA